MMKYSVSCIIVFLCFFSCKKSPESNESQAQERLFNLANAGWKSKVISHHISNINYRATQVPIQYYILKNADDKSPIAVDSIYESLRKERIIEFEFQHDSKDDLLKNKFTNRGYTEAVKYMAFKIVNDFSVITSSGDTVKCAGVTFERNFKLAPFKRVLLNFGNIPADDNIKLIYDDKLFGNGLFKFNFKETPIKL